MYGCAATERHLDPLHSNLRPCTPNSTSRIRTTMWDLQRSSSSTDRGRSEATLERSFDSARGLLSHDGHRIRHIMIPTETLDSTARQGVSSSLSVDEQHAYSRRSTKPKSSKLPAFALRGPEAFRTRGGSRHRGATDDPYVAADEGRKKSSSAWRTADLNVLATSSQVYNDIFRSSRELGSREVQGSGTSSTTRSRVIQDPRGPRSRLDASNPSHLEASHPSSRASCAQQT